MQQGQNELVTTEVGGGRRWAVIRFELGLKIEIVRILVKSNMGRKQP